MKKKKASRAIESGMARLQAGDVVLDYDKEPDPNTNQGRVEKVLDDQLVRVLWRGGTTTDRPANRLAKISITESYKRDPAARQRMWDKILQMSDEEMDAELERLEQRLNLN
ncbi:hypothetical protein ACM41_21385 [Bradyrhizobium sp. CCBAU 21362]|uniref:hypothetical protein n=1 Tax=Bradyrhizobium sp. CCBAU 21362 TaxID=1325082 RepID=UPI0023068025|nr:hypothetical protein [Bradyrhizobium sp. CCBAU 21362]MDA9538670.1 hypothetical protein [Bradyrhizobium sp. CCBAU 21362]